MGTKKQAGGVEDLTFGVGTEKQVRKGQTTTITQINAEHIPLTSAQNVKQKFENVDGTLQAHQTVINNLGEMAYVDDAPHDGQVYGRMNGQWATNLLFQGGDMYKSTYDTNDNGIVDDAEKLGGEAPSYYATQASLTNHLNDSSNPHNVTAVQVGALTPDGDGSQLTGITASQVGADPAGSAQAVQDNLDTHTGDTNNPHSVTASQVGAEPVVVPGNPGQIWATNAAGDGKEWIDAPTSAEWGNITGDINAQTDLQNEFLNKADPNGDTASGPIRMPYVVTEATQTSRTIATGTNAIMGSFELPDGETLTVEDGGTLIIV